MTESAVGHKIPAVKLPEYPLTLQFNGQMLTKTHNPYDDHHILRSILELSFILTIYKSSIP